MPSSYITTVAPKWAASSNATIEGITVQFSSLPLEGRANISNSSVTITAYDPANSTTQFAETQTRRKELSVGDTILIRPLGTGNFTNARVVTTITNAS